MSVDNILAMQVSVAAKQHLLQHIKLNKACGVKFSMQPDGCAGYGYQVTFPLELDAANISFDINGLLIIVDLASQALLTGVNIDLQAEGLGQKQLVFNNPQVKSACGCGLSVQIDNKQ